MGSADPLVAAAAAEALGKIGSAQAAAALAKADVPAKALAALHNARLQCAERLTAAGNPAGAAAIYEQVWSSKGPSAWRLAGLTGLAKVDPDKAAPLVLEAIVSPDPLVQATAVRASAKLPGAQVTAALVGQLDKLGAAGQVLLVGVLAERGDRAAAAAVIKRMADQDEAVRVAAVRAMARLGDVSLVERLAGLATAAGRGAAGGPREPRAPGRRRRRGKTAGHGGRGRPGRADRGAPHPGGPAGRGAGPVAAEGRGRRRSPRPRGGVESLAMAARAGELPGHGPTAGGGDRCGCRCWPSRPC